MNDFHLTLGIAQIWSISPIGARSDYDLIMHKSLADIMQPMFQVDSSNQKLCIMQQLLHNNYIG